MVLCMIIALDTLPALPAEFSPNELIVVWRVVRRPRTTEVN